MTARRALQLVAFDVDGTLVGNREGKVVWELFNRHFCGDDSVNKERLRAYLEGEISYPRWVELDVQDWIAEGATRAQMAAVISAELRLTPGARRTVQALRDAGLRLAVISGTLDLTLEILFPEHPFEEVYTNRIAFDERGLIASWKATPFDMEGKARALVEIAGRMGLPLERTVFVGDNINDLHVMKKAGLAVAYDPKHSSVSEAADLVISELTELLPALGLPQLIADS